MRETHLSAKTFFDANAAAKALEGLTGPFHFLDFESVQFAAPIWAGTHPYQQIVFQYSLHTVDSLSAPVPTHREFLGVLGGNPTYEAALALCAHLRGDGGTIFVYNASFERGRIEEMAYAFADLRAELLALLPRIVDLLPILRAVYYHPKMRGSWSIKAVLPCIAPGLAYSELGEVQSGTDAMAVYRAMLEEGVFDAARCAALRAYCARDTKALIRVAQFLCTGGAQ